MTRSRDTNETEERLEIKVKAATPKGSIVHNCGRLDLKANDDEDVRVLTWLFKAIRSGFISQLSEDWDPETKAGMTSKP